MKALREKKQLLVAEYEQLLNIAKVETRALDSSELEKVEEIKTKINEINSTLELLSEQTEEVKEDEPMEERSMNNTELRNRLLKGEGIEVRAKERAMNTTSTGTNLLSSELHNSIVKKLDEYSGILGLTNIIHSDLSEVQFLVESNIGADAVVIGEMANATPQDFGNSKKSVKALRLATALEVSEKLIMDTGFDIVSYIQDVCERRIGTALAKGFVTGLADGTSKIEGMNSLSAKAMETGKSQVVEIDDIMDMLNSMHPTLQNGAVWVMNRKLFNHLAKLKDSVGNYYITRQLNIIDNKPVYMLFGCPVHINDAVSEQITTANQLVCYLVNPYEAYRTLVKKGMTIKMIDSDSTNALRGSKTFVADMYLGAVIADEQAIKILKVKA